MLGVVRGGKVRSLLRRPQGALSGVDLLRSKCLFSEYPLCAQHKPGGLRPDPLGTWCPGTERRSMW